ncbi:MAG: hypothetical protein CMP76_02785 [Flavobacterium sp.]|uniref:hypothetical protein n=1 Tax=Flavobacterium sp. TaxID=239 RepID=UPI000C53267A|nr:hypothetical protein [Flavobacterium sp.]MBF02202.1 hypothetical protein [Flavobacterium sp.]
MSVTKQLVLLLGSLEKKEFDKIVKIYLQNEYDSKAIVFTDGKDDIGLDIKVFDYNGRDIQYQLTIQKSTTASERSSFENKLFEDLEKANINAKNYGYSNNLIFFYSHPLTNKRIRTYTKIAFKDYNINLELIEANRIAQEAEEILEIQRELYKISELDKFKASDSHFDNTLFYDLLSFGRPTEFKIQVIESFILQLFCSIDKLTKERIIELCKEKFHVDENDDFYDRMLGRFMTEKKIYKDKTDQSFSLTPKEKAFLKGKNEQFEIDKTVFLKNISAILIEHGQIDYIDDYVRELKQLYIDNFNTDLKDVISNETEFHVQSTFKPFIKFIETNIKEKEQAKKLSIELLKYCLDNKFIQKLAATKVYSSKVDNGRLQNYINKQKKIFIDTSVGLFALCLFYKPNTSFDNYFFKATKSLIDYSRKEKSHLYISERYIWEIANHIRDAFRLIPFSLIENFHVLGASRNVFYNFYNSLIKSGEIDSEKKFSEFLDDFGFVEGASNESLNSVIEYSLENVNVYKQVISKEYKIDQANKLFEEAMLKYFKHKNTFTRNCDSIMLEFLGDKDVEVHPVDPLFLTWDKTFFEVHTKYLEKFPNAQNWLILSPNKIVDIYALLKFSINSETVTENLLALISDDIVSNTHSLIDVLAFVLNPKDEIGLEYTKRLAKIRDEEINQINRAEFIPPENFEGQAVIDDIFLRLTTHFSEENKLSKFKTLFTKKEFLDEVVDILNFAIKEFYSTQKIDQNALFEKFEKLIESIPED